MVNANRRLPPEFNECGIPVCRFQNTAEYVGGKPRVGGLTVPLDGDHIRGSEFGDSGVATGDPAKDIYLLGVSQAVSNGIGNDFQ